MKDNLYMKAVASVAMTTALALAPSMVNAAENLRLASGVSYTSDIGNIFPIVGDKLDDFTVEPGRPALIFFGAPGDLNTNRQAKRVVQLYQKHRDDTKFIIVNVDDPNSGARELIKSYYPGYVPAQLLIDRSGKKVWSQVGETSRKQMSGRINNM